MPIYLRKSSAFPIEYKVRSRLRRPAAQPQPFEQLHGKAELFRK
jgi:hypothetical protein